MAERTYRTDKEKAGRKGSHKRWQDSASHIWKARILQVEQGETTGVCAEAKRLWKEAGLAHRWPPAATRHIQKESRKAIALAAETIALTRLLTLARDKSDATQTSSNGSRWIWRTPLWARADAPGTATGPGCSPSVPPGLSSDILDRNVE